MKKGGSHQFAIIILGGLMFLVIFSSKVLAEEYVFERMWPVLPQPWHVGPLKDVAPIGTGNVYVEDSFAENAKS